MPRYQKVPLKEGEKVPAVPLKDFVKTQDDMREIRKGEKINQGEA